MGSMDFSWDIGTSSNFKRETTDSNVDEDGTVSGNQGEMPQAGRASVPEAQLHRQQLIRRADDGYDPSKHTYIKNQDGSTLFN